MVYNKTLAKKWYKMNKKTISKNGKIKRQKLKSKGYCVRHIHRKAVFGTTMCLECLNNKKEYFKKMKFDKKCPNHSNEVVSFGHTVCDKCLEHSKKISRERKKNGKCHGHPNKKVVPGHSSCKECLWYTILRKNKVTNKQVTIILEKQKYICPLSGRKLIEGINTSVDHIVHKCNNGSNKIDNIRFTDIDANIFRKDFSDKKLYKISRDIYFILRMKYERK